MTRSRPYHPGARRRIQALLAACCTIGCIVPAAEAGETLRFPPRTEVAGHTLELRGTGLLRYKRLIPVYDAALYLDPETAAEQVLDDVPKRIEVLYRRRAEARRFAEAGDRILARTFPEEALEKVRRRVDEINTWYPDPEPGDRCAISYIPGKGTELVFNGRSLGWIEGSDFARVYFAIWLGPEPASRSLRRALLSSSPPH